MPTKKELLVRAAELSIKGRSTMKKAELEAMIAQAEGRNEPASVEYGTAVPLGDTRPYEEKATEALLSVLKITKDTLEGNSPLVVPVHDPMWTPVFEDPDDDLLEDDIVEEPSSLPPQRRREVPREVLKRRSKRRAAKHRMRVRKRGH